MIDKKKKKAFLKNIVKEKAKSGEGSKAQTGEAAHYAFLAKFKK